MPSGDDGGDAQARGRMRFTARMYSVSSPAMRRTARSKLHPFSFSFYLSPSKCSPSEVCALTAKIVSPERGTHGSPPGGSTGAGACTRRDGIGDGIGDSGGDAGGDAGGSSIGDSGGDVTSASLVSHPGGAGIGGGGSASSPSDVNGEYVGDGP